MIRRAEPFAYYSALARIEQGDGLPAKLVARQFGEIGQVIAWGREMLASDARISLVLVYGIDESAGFADSVWLGSVDAQGWCCIATVDPTQPLR